MGNNCCTANEKTKQSGFVSLNNNNNNNDINDPSSPNSSTILTSGTNSTPITTNTSILQKGLISNLAPNSAKHGLTDKDNNNNTNGGNGIGNGNGNNIQSIKAEEQAAAEREERQRALQQEKNRLEEIVALAGRDMVPLVIRGGGSMNSLNTIGGFTSGSGGSGGGNMTMLGNVGASGGGYYDPGYANFIMQDLSMAFMSYNQSVMEEEAAEAAAAANNNNHNLQKKNIFHQYRNIPETSIRDGRDAIDILCSNSSSRTRIEKDHDLDLEDMAETFLTSVFCTKEGLLKGIGPIVENVFTAGD
jgi:hypothetical protein